jgi:hypothetical protein
MKLGQWLSLGILLAVAATAPAAPIEVGSGVNDARVRIEWFDGFGVEFLVRFGQTETETITGEELLNLIEAADGLEWPMRITRTQYTWGSWIDDIAYQDHSSLGGEGGEPWWHYWNDKAGKEGGWGLAGAGASDRIVRHGDADAWVFGHGDAPKPQWELPFLSGYKHYVYDANDFATACVAYQPQGMMNDWFSRTPYNDPNVALGRPTVDTTGDDWIAPVASAIPVTPVYPAFRSHEIVFLGGGGSITLAFNHPVRDDASNPYGIDFIVFGNNCLRQRSGDYLSGGDLADVVVGGSDTAEPGIVSVSQDGVTWYSFTTDPNFMAADANFIKLPAEAADGPFCDSFAPTMGRVYDPCNADASVGQTNRPWAEPTNPTLPLDPTVTLASLSGRSVARVAQTYGDSAGGTGYDLARLDLPVDPNTQLKWFKYIRIDDAPVGGEPEIDAVADVSCPGDYRHPAPLGDVNGDFRVDAQDEKIVSDCQGRSITDPNAPEAAADLNGDGIVDAADVTIVQSNKGTVAWGQI